MSEKRVDGRSADELRPVRITAGVNPYAEGSAEVEFGNTKVLVSASVETEVPRWIPEGSGGWITAEYGMLPRATHTRSKREAASGKQGGRTLEIQRLIGRSLRAAVDLSLLGEITIRFDCDVIRADGGTRTASISGAWVALSQAICWASKQDLLKEQVSPRHVVAVSVGIVEGESRLDLCYEEDSAADFDLNLVFNDALEIVEVQGTAEGSAITSSELDSLIRLGAKGAKEIIEEQKRALSEV